MDNSELYAHELYDVSGFEIVADYTIKVEFDDDTQQIINFEPVLHGPLFGPLRDQELFHQVKLDPELGTLVWPNDADIDPSILHNWPDHVEAIIERRKKWMPVTSSDPGPAAG